MCLPALYGRVARAGRGLRGPYTSPLTDKQGEALELAFEQGYYEIPRDTTAKEFAEAVGISHQALSERLRRAHKNLAENTVVFGRDTNRTRR